MTTDQCNSCNDSNCSASRKRTGEGDAEFHDRQALSSRMCRIRHKVTG